VILSPIVRTTRFPAAADSSAAADSGRTSRISNADNIMEKHLFTVIYPKGFIGAGFYKTLPVCQLIFCVLTDDDRQIVFHLFPSASNGKLSLKSYQIPG
jgi:hypothetical protein